LIPLMNQSLSQRIVVQHAGHSDVIVEVVEGFKTLTR